MEWNNGTLEAMPEPLAAEFRQQWNAWLGKKYGNQAKLLAAWDEGAEPLGGEMLKAEREAWTFEQHGSAKATRDFIAGDSGETMHVRVSEPGAEAWHVQVGQPGLALARSKTYTITLRAKADARRRITINLGQARAPWKVLATRDAKLTTEWQELCLSIPIAEAEETARLAISNLGSAPGEYWFTGISLRPGGIIALNEGEKLGSIPVFRKKEIGARTLAAQRDWNEFLVDTETTYWTGMQRFIRDDLHATA
jgi:hypothetical protein